MHSVHSPERNAPARTHQLQCAAPKLIIFDTKSILFDTESIIFNRTFITWWIKRSASASTSALIENSIKQHKNSMKQHKNSMKSHLQPLQIADAAESSLIDTPLETTFIIFN